MLRGRRIFLAVITPLAISVAGAELAAQDARRAAGLAGAIMAGPRAQTAPDSASVLRAARNAQATFERARRSNLPRKFSTAPSRCDETIGRFCYWDDGTAEDELVRTPAPPESPRTIEARNRLLAHLDSASGALPHDEWIAGMHVHYLVEAGRLDAALERARHCGASEWWCAALVALVHHAAWRYAEADSVFAVAIATMPEAERCEWTNLEELLRESERDSYKRTACAEREPLNDRIWWLADPLFSRAGNDRRTEHYARVLRARLHRRAASAYGMTWRDDLEEIVHRYGWPSHYSQAIPASHQQAGPPSISSYHESPSYHFLADVGVAGDTRAIPDSSWSLRPRATRERYGPPYGTFAALRHQASLFRRGDSVLLVVAYDARGDSLIESRPITAAAIASAGPRAQADYRIIRHDGNAHGALTLMMPDTGVLASIELLAGARVRRARFGSGFPAASPHPFRISDVALFRPGTEPPTSLEVFLPLARASDTVQAREKIGLFWEVYAPEASSAEATLNVEIVREGTGWLRRAGERVGLVGAPGRTRFGWRQSAGGTSIAARSVVVDLQELDPGQYRIEVSVTPDGLAPVVAQRRIRIVR